jgi:16S rRNA (uracil1498-N3)-methyltransferase
MSPMRARFYAPDVAGGADLVDLPDDEARHLTRVRRLGAGDEIAVFDGRGHEYRARVEQAGRAGVRVRVLEAVTPAPEPAVALTLVQAVLKGDHMDEIVRDAVMMGVAAIQPIVTARTQVSLAALRRGSAADRWQRIAIASVKQCHRAVVPAIRAPRALDEFVRTGGGAGTMRLMLVEPGAGAAGVQDAHGLSGCPRPSAADLLVGPEGGWAAEEVERAVAHGFLTLTLGRRTLRADAAPVAAIAVLQFLWRDL